MNDRFLLVMMDSTNMSGLQKNDKNSILTEIRNRKNTKQGPTTPVATSVPVSNPAPQNNAINLNMKTEKSSL